MTDWLKIRNANAKALPSEGLRTSPTAPKTEPIDVAGGYCRIHGEFDAPCSECCRYLMPGEGPVPLEALIGPAELAQLAGVPRGSIAHMMSANGMPAPCLVLQGIRLWDARAIQAWQASRTRTD